MLNKDTGQEKLYRYLDDPAENRMILDEYPTIAKEMRTYIADHILGLKVFAETTRADTHDSPEMLARLRDLGYIGQKSEPGS